MAGEYLKPQSPLMYSEDYIYPPTTADQVIKSDGNRLEQDGQVVADKVKHGLYANPDATGEVGEPLPINADMLDGKTVEGIRKGLVSETRTVNGKALHDDVKLIASDVGIQVGANNAEIEANSYADVEITFPIAFSTTPHVITSFVIPSTETNSELAHLLVAASSISTTGFTMRYFNASSTNRKPTAHWIAVGGV